MTTLLRSFRYAPALAALLFAAASLPALHADTPAAQTDSATQKRAETKAARVLDGLKISDAAKATQAQSIISDWFITLWAWHQQHDSQLKDLWSQWAKARSVVPKDEFPGEVIAYQIDSLYTSLRPAYEEFLTQLATALTAEQIEAIKETWSRSPGMRRTYNAYLAIVPDLTEEQKRVILDRMLRAREDAMLTDADKEIVNIYKRHKVKVEAYVGSLAWAKLHKAYANGGK